MANLTVKELRDYLNTLPDNMPVILQYDGANWAGQTTLFAEHPPNLENYSLVFEAEFGQIGIVENYNG